MRNAGDETKLSRWTIEFELTPGRLKSSTISHPGVMFTIRSPEYFTEVLRFIAAALSPAREAIMSSMVNTWLTPLMRSRNSAASLRSSDISM